MTVDLNADLGEGVSDQPSPTDFGVIAVVTSVSIACGFHAGSTALMRATAEACRAAGVVIGAHPSYRDRAGFGRRPVAVDVDLLRNELVEQCATLDVEVAAAGGRVAYVKPHGALYHRMATDPEVAAMVVDVVAGRPSPVLVAPPGGPLTRLAAAGGVTLAVEGFPDRGYLPDGSLAPRDHPAGVVADPAEAARRAVQLARHGGIPAVDGTWVDVDVRTLCIHGDAPEADRRAYAVRAALVGAGVAVGPFVAGPTGEEGGGGRSGGRRSVGGGR